jgi:hypothetical protein
VSEHTKRAEALLAEAARLIAGERQREYGPPTENFAVVSRLWNIWISARAKSYVGIGGLPPAFLLSPGDIAAMLLLLKVARLAQSLDHHDSKVDIAGYAALMEEVCDGAGSSEPPGDRHEDRSGC